MLYIMNYFGVWTTVIINIWLLLIMISSSVIYSSISQSFSALTTVGNKYSLLLLLNMRLNFLYLGYYYY